ncbi:hypothetical protein Tco_1035292 [Tanacetum coccineum]
MENKVDVSALTMEQYIALILDDIKPDIVNPKIGDDIEFEDNEIYGELRRKLFACINGEDAYKHVRTISPARKILDSNGFIPLMTPTQALESIQVMADHSHNWYDETTTRERINDVLNNIDAIHKSFKGEHLTKEYPLIYTRETADDERMRKILENTESNIRALKTRTKNLHEKAYQLTHKVLTNTGEKVKAIKKIGKENMKESVHRDLPPTPFLGHLKEQMGSPYRTRETVQMIGYPEEIHN